MVDRSVEFGGARGTHWLQRCALGGDSPAWGLGLGIWDRQGRPGQVGGVGRGWGWYGMGRTVQEMLDRRQDDQRWGLVTTMMGARQGAVDVVCSEGRGLPVETRGTDPAAHQPIVEERSLLLVTRASSSPPFGAEWGMMHGDGHLGKRSPPPPTN